MEQFDFDAARDVLEYMIESTQCHEPYAVNTIAELEAALHHITRPEDYPEAT